MAIFPRRIPPKRSTGAALRGSPAEGNLPGCAAANPPRREPVTGRRSSRAGEAGTMNGSCTPTIEAPAAAAPRDSIRTLTRKTGRAIQDYAMIGEGDRVLVAVSGGKDSYALLDLLERLRRRSPVRF